MLSHREAMIVPLAHHQWFLLHTEVFACQELLLPTKVSACQLLGQSLIPLPMCLSRIGWGLRLQHGKLT